MQRLISLIKAVTLLALAFVISGCSDLVEVQDRDFVLALGVSVKNDKFELTYALPDLSALTKDEKKDENEGGNGQTRTYEGAAPAEIEELYNHGSNKRLDYRHLEAIILDEAAGSAADKLAVLLDYVENNYEISRNVRVFYYPGDVKKLLETKGAIGGGIGEYLKKLEKHNQRKNGLPAVTIGNMIYSLSHERGLVIPLLELEEDKLKVNGAAVFQASAFIKKLSEEELKTYYVINGVGKELDFHTQEDTVFRLKQFKSKTRYVYENNKPVILLTITGTAEVLSEADKNAPSIEMGINEYLRDAVLKQLNAVFKDGGVDYVNFYDESGIKNKDIWLAYRDRRDDFVRDTVFKVGLGVNVR